jgi:very-short-patch-repair endonuclease
MSIDRFVVDYCCPDARLIVEIDGGQHDESRNRDIGRTRVLEAMGYIVLRFWNHDVIRNIDGVLEEILSTLNLLRSEPPHPNPLPRAPGLPGSRLEMRKSGKPDLRGEREQT